MIMKSKLMWIVLGCAATISALSAEQTESSRALGQIDANHLTLTFLFQSGSAESREEINLKRTETRPS